MSMYLQHIKGKVTVLSPHPGSELCSADFDKFLPWSLGLYSPHIHLDFHLNSLGSIQPLARNLAPRLTNLPSQLPISSWVETSNAAWSALLRGTTSSRNGRLMNPGLDLDPNPEFCTLPLDQLTAIDDQTIIPQICSWFWKTYFGVKISRFTTQTSLTVFYSWANYWQWIDIG